MLNKLLSLALVLGVAMLPSTEAISIKAAAQEDQGPPPEDLNTDHGDYDTS